jgi:hypothetical protein
VTTACGTRAGALLWRHRGTIGEVITIITLITLTITLITLCKEGVCWDCDAHHDTKLVPVRLRVTVVEVSGSYLGSRRTIFSEVCHMGVFWGRIRAGR